MVFSQMFPPVQINRHTEIQYTHTGSHRCMHTRMHINRPTYSLISYDKKSCVTLPLNRLGEARFDFPLCSGKIQFNHDGSFLWDRNNNPHPSSDKGPGPGCVNIWSHGQNVTRYKPLLQVGL